jgi:hypothetical protein
MEQQIQTHTSGVAPDIAAPSRLFDNHAASKARPVVPLVENSTVNGAAAPRRSWLVAAIAVSAIIGSLTGIAAFSIYQRRHADNVSLPPAATLPAASLENPTPAETANNEISDKPFDKSLPDAATRKAELNHVAIVPVTTASPAVSDLNTDRRATDVAAKPATEVTAERPRTDKKNERQEARAKNQDERATSTVKEPAVVARNEQPAPATVRRAPEGVRQRRETPANSSTDDAEPSSRPGYVDAVRRAIGDRPARRNRRARDGNADRVREIFEGQPPRR